jgi:hypothetical protein
MMPSDKYNVKVGKLSMLFSGTAIVNEEEPMEFEISHFKCRIKFMTSPEKGSNAVEAENAFEPGNFISLIFWNFRGASISNQRPGPIASWMGGKIFLRYTVTRIYPTVGPKQESIYTFNYSWLFGKDGDNV